MQTPVLLIIFNRPNLTQQVMEAISRVKPRTLLVAADGPRFPEESEKCQQAREVIYNIKWECTVLRNYSESNLGCGIRVYTAVDWALSQFEEIIILEDDCIPTPSFFRFCEELLCYYRHDKRVMHISGNNFQLKQTTNDYSYYFSKYTHAWGWATWRRAWEHFDWGLKLWPELKAIDMICCWCDDPYEQRYWIKIFDEMSKGVPDIWDYHWNFACWSQNGLSVIPSVNLVSNIGFGLDATHTKDYSPYLNLQTSEINKINHPPFVSRAYKADAYTFENNFGGAAMKQADSLKAKLKKKLRPLTLPYRAARKLWRVINR